MRTEKSHWYPKSAAIDWTKRSEAAIRDSQKDLFLSFFPHAESLFIMSSFPGNDDEKHPPGITKTANCRRARNGNILCCATKISRQSMASIRGSLFLANWDTGVMPLIFSASQILSQMRFDSQRECKTARLMILVMP